MIAGRLQPIGWVMAVAVAALSFYLVSLRVATERAALEGAERSIAAAHRDIRRLGTELATRGSLHQLEQWNRQVLSLTSPGAAQYLRGAQQLASLGAAPPPAAGEGRVMQAAAITPRGDAPPIIPAVVRDAPPVSAPVIRTAALAQPASPAATLQRAAYTPTLLASGTMNDLARRAADEADGR